MNKQELDAWIKSAKRIDITENKYDENNHHQTNIYEKDGKLYKISFCNGYPTAKWNNECGYESERDAEGKRIKDARGQNIYIYEIVPVKAYPQITVSKNMVYVTANESIPEHVVVYGYRDEELSKEDKDIVIERLIS